MATDHLPSFAALRLRYGNEPAPIARRNEREHLITYLREHGASVTTAEDVYHAVLTLDHEEELSAFRCREGIAVSNASDGWWVLLRNNEPLAQQGRPVGAGRC